MDTSERSYRKYLDPKTLARIARLDLRARLVVEGYVSGMHRSPYRGYSIEFAEHRQYAQGDDLRHVDWKVFGRTDKFYVRQYEEETNLQCLLALDCSESMTFRSASAALSKYEYGLALAASLAYLALHQQDAVGLALFDRTIRRFVRPSNSPGYWRILLAEMENGPGPAKTALRSTLDELAQRLPRRALVVLISDLFDDPQQVVRGLQHLRYRKHDVIVLHVMDEAELTLPYSGPTLFEGLEGLGKLRVEPRALRRRYREEVERFLDRLRVGCRDLHIDYALLRTSQPLDVALSAFLASRNASIK